MQFCTLIIVIFFGQIMNWFEPRLRKRSDDDDQHLNYSSSGSVSCPQ